jgi:NADPH:quinone reductase-like Zn-dependent oxidoreductase
MKTLKYPIKSKGFALNLIDDRNAVSSDRIKLIEKTIHPLAKGQVLVKMLAAPVNPSDLVYLLGKYGIAPVNNAIVGFEGCGIVVDANAGIYGKWLIGKRVAVSAAPALEGVWAEYAVSKANYCLPIRKDISDAQASTIIVNPLTAICMVERAIALKSKAIVLNAAASQVGKGVIKYAKMRGIKTIATVRSKANISVLELLGADKVLDTNEPDFLPSLKQISEQWQATVFLDAISAKESALVLHAMPKQSTAIVYGRLHETYDPLGGYFSVADVIFKNNRIEGFWLANYMAKASPLQVLALSRKVQKLFASEVFKTDIFAEVGFNNFAEKLNHYAVHKSDGKVILRPNN